LKFIYRFIGLDSPNLQDYADSTARTHLPRVLRGLHGSSGFFAAAKEIIVESKSRKPVAK
jgi:hypothetical protein